MTQSCFSKACSYF